MTSWATLAQARTHWADAKAIDDGKLSTLLDVATTACAAYAPAVVPNPAAATIRTNRAPQTMGDGVASLAGLGFVRATGSVGAGCVRATITDATLAFNGQRVNTPNTNADPMRVVVTPGVMYTVGADLRSTIVTGTWFITLTYYNVSNVTVGSAATGAPTPIVSASAFAPLSAVSMVAPAGATLAFVQIGIDATTPRTIGDTFDVRKLIVEAAPNPGPFFDGDTPDAAGVDYAWTGTARASTSTATTTPDLVPTNYMLATVYQAREIYAAAARDSQDVIGFGDFAIRARPLTTAVKALLRPQRAIGAMG